MTFAKVGVMSLPIPTTTKKEGKDIQYKGVKEDGSFGGSVAKLPSGSDGGEPVYGVDARIFKSVGGNASPKGFGLHKQGKINFAKLGDFGFNVQKDNDFYVLSMLPDDTKSNSGFDIPNGGTPYFFRLKGGAEERIPQNNIAAIDASSEVISLTIDTQAPDYFHVKGSASIELYNRGGQFDFLKEESYGVEISIGWDDDVERVFTGITHIAGSSETAGLEKLNVTCDDYMYILQASPILNSPFYDGMDAFAAIQDIARRGGIQTIHNDIEAEKAYFLPQGFAFSNPKMRFPATNKLFDCMINIVMFNDIEYIE